MTLLTLAVRYRGREILRAYMTQCTVVGERSRVMWSIGIEVRRYCKCACMLMASGTVVSVVVANIVALGVEIARGQTVTTVMLSLRMAHLADVLIMRGTVCKRARTGGSSKLNLLLKVSASGGIVVVADIVFYQLPIARAEPHILFLQVRIVTDNTLVGTHVPVAILCTRFGG